MALIIEDFESAKRSDSVDNQPIEFTPLARNQSRNGPQTAPNAHEVLIFYRHLPLCAFANVSTRPPPPSPSHHHPPQNYIKMAGAAAGSRVADVLHKTVTTGLIVITIAGVADVVRGFGVLTKRNIDRRSGGADDAAPSTGGASSREE